MQICSRTVALMLFACVAPLLMVFASPVVAQDRVSPLNEAGQLVDFQRDIAPIFATRCLECQGACYMRIIWSVRIPIC